MFDISSVMDLLRRALAAPNWQLSPQLPSATPMAMASHDSDKGRSILGLSLSSANCPLRKSKEQKLAERETELLDIAADLIEREGFASFTMDKLVALSGYSKGTIYNHFSSKEDCLAALCIRGIDVIGCLFDKALAFDGRPREKMVALNYAYQLYTQWQPTLSLAVLTARTPAFAEKTSEQRSALMLEKDHAITLKVDEVFRDAIEQGDLDPAINIPVPLMSLLCWSQAFGINALTGTAPDLTAVSRLDGVNVQLLSANVLLDGLGFQPLSRDWDYQATWERVGRECFSDEIQLLNNNNNHY
ncbi:TetR/AcrR family transcriptional regulator [Thalassolituus marinus]|uniref:TetR/AcrR family transcriptional regulator n=1 Tax=Thalassolituus marinus TaxID=671053 RepID=A0ABS7ZY81_9GAMM|nr:TetR/AcrR family transcriptional regulator [Thalassolituus marinus]MCA6065330.1 TetR/AcrR family transcriptional regulator [Thalassolituus marinus]